MISLIASGTLPVRHGQENHLWNFSALNHAVSTLGLRRGHDELGEKNCQGTNGQVEITVEERQ